MITVSDGGDLGENFATRAMTNLAERGSLGENRILKDQLKGRLMLSDGGLFAPTPVVAIAPKMYRNASSTAMLAVDN
jgi:hypothetical protein